MKRIIAFGLVLCFFGCFSALAQEQRIYNQFFINPFIYNPAYAGVEGHTVFYLTYRNQWPGLDGTPTVNNFNFHTPLKGGIGIGAEFLNDTKADVLKTNEARVAASYLATFDNKHYIRFGLSLGAGSSGLDFDKVSRLDINDQTLLANTVDQSTYVLGSFGATYHTGHFNIGLSLPSLINSAPVAFESFQSPEFGPLDNVLVKVNYRGHLNDNIAIEPHLLYRYNNYGTSQLEFTTIFHILHIVWVGGSYLQDAGVTGYAGIKIKDKFAVGAAFSPGKQSISSFTGSALEIKMGYHLGGRKKHAEHVSSFIKSHRKTLEERQEEAEKKRQAKLLAEEEAEAEEQRKEEAIAQRKQEIEEREAQREAEREAALKAMEEEKEMEAAKEKAQTPEKEPVSASTQPEKTPKEDPNKAIAQEKPAKPVEQSENNTGEQSNNNFDEKADVAKKETTKQTAKSPDAERKNRASVKKPVSKADHEALATRKEPLRVKRGNHLLELAQGNYVIAGAFRVFENAERYSDDLFLKGYHGSKIGFVSDTQFYYVVVDNYETVRDASKRKNRLQKTSGFEKSWVLIVE